MGLKDWADLNRKFLIEFGDFGLAENVNGIVSATPHSLEVNDAKLLSAISEHCSDNFVECLSTFAFLIFIQQDESFEPSHDVSDFD